MFLYQLSRLFGIISRRFSGKLKQFNKKLQKCFSPKKIKRLLRFFYLIMGYGLRKVMTESPDKE